MAKLSKESHRLSKSLNDYMEKHKDDDFSGKKKKVAEKMSSVNKNFPNYSYKGGK